jgi:hypothetical protein
MSGYHRRVAQAEPKPVVWEGMRTPWGAAQDARVVAPGVGWVGTSGHGGVKLSLQLNRRMPDYMRRLGGWYEEDCDWALPYVALADHLRQGGPPGRRDEDEAFLAAAVKTLRDWHPDAYERFTGEAIPEGGSHVKDELAFKELHKGDLVAVSAADSQTRPGFVEVTTSVGGLRSGFSAERGRERIVPVRRFLVPKGEYTKRSPFGFVVADPSRYEEITG